MTSEERYIQEQADLYQRFKHIGDYNKLDDKLKFINSKLESLGKFGTNKFPPRNPREDLMKRSAIYEIKILQQQKFRVEEKMKMMAEVLKQDIKTI